MPQQTQTRLYYESGVLEAGETAFFHGFRTPNVVFYTQQRDCVLPATFHHDGWTEIFPVDEDLLWIAVSPTKSVVEMKPANWEWVYLDH